MERKKLVSICLCDGAQHIRAQEGVKNHLARMLFCSFLQDVCPTGTGYLFSEDSLAISTYASDIHCNQ